MRDVNVGDRVTVGECAAILREEEAELERLLAAKRAERIRVEEVARRFVDAEAQRYAVDRRRRVFGWVLVSGMAVPDSFDCDAMWNGEEPLPGSDVCGAGVSFVLYERVETPAGEVRVFTDERVDPRAVLRAVAAGGALDSVASTIVEGLKATVGDVKRRVAAVEAARVAAPFSPFGSSTQTGGDSAAGGRAEGASSPTGLLTP